MMRFRSLETRIVVFFVILLLAVQSVTFVLISAANRETAKRAVADQLDVGERVFRELIAQNGRQLTQAATVLAADFAFREAIGTRDNETIVSALRNHGARINASMVMLADLDAHLIADTLHKDNIDRPFPFGELVARAAVERHASAVAIIDGEPYQVVVVPVLSPLPMAWLAMGFKIDDKLAQGLRSLTGLEVSFLVRQPLPRGGVHGAAAAMRPGPWRIRASTLAPANRYEVATHFGELLEKNIAQTTLTLGNEPYETRAIELIDINDLPPAGAGGAVGTGDDAAGEAQDQGAPPWQIGVTLQQSLNAALKPFLLLRNTLLALALASLAVSLVGSLMLGRSLARPINRLAALARRIRDGDYSQVAEVTHKDQIGELAQSLNHMREAISTREDKILTLAYRDTLTSLPNRAYFKERLTHALEHAAANNGDVTMLILDLDRFKYVNDALGHPVGDIVLREVAARLASLMREGDIAARLGGDEFAVILPATGLRQARDAAAAILRAFEKPVIVDGDPLDVAASIGIANYPRQARDAMTLMRHADAAMYLAKRGNRGYAVYSHDYEQPRRDYLRLLSDLRVAIERDELVLYFQPKIDLKSGSVTQAEALIRWIHPQRGFVPPSDFIPFAEQTGFIRTITRWVIHKAILQSRLWMERGVDMVISLNISSRDLIGNELPTYIAMELAHECVPAHRIALEITESGFMEDPEQALTTLRKFDELGLSISIDDYGTGYSSLSYIKKLPVHELKIDQSFVRNMTRDDDDATIVKSTIELGHNLGLKVVAEGVEDIDSMAMLKSLGCDHAQGFHLSKPLSARMFEAWLSSQKDRQRDDEAAREAALSKTVMLSIVKGVDML